MHREPENRFVLPTGRQHTLVVPAAQEDHCPVNPVTGRRGFSRAPVGAPGHLRDPRGGAGHWKASRGNGERKHWGLDIAGLDGESPLYAVLSGRVEFSGSRTDAAGRPYGNLVRIDHGGGLETRYAHNARNLVVARQRVARGEQIAILGDTGNAEGLPPHVHFEVWKDGVRINPEAFLNAPCRSTPR